MEQGKLIEAQEQLIAEQTKEIVSVKEENVSLQSKGTFYKYLSVGTFILGLAIGLPLALP